MRRWAARVPTDHLRWTSEMEQRRRKPQVRPRPPNSGRSRPVRARPVAPSVDRLSSHKRINRGPGLPLAARGALAAGVVALIGAVIWVGSGGIGPALDGLSTAIGGAVQRVTVTPSPTVATPEPASDAPTILSPEQPFVRTDTIDVTVQIPHSVAGHGDHTVRLWLTRPDKAPQVVGRAEVGVTPTVVLPDVPLVKGRNAFQATILGPSFESKPSKVVTWILDLVRPPITIRVPKTDNAVVNRRTIGITGRTQSGSSIVARNEATGATATTQAGDDGTFVVQVALAEGTNGITIRITDPAGNVSEKVVTVRRGTGKLIASLRASSYYFKVSNLPDPVEFSVTVTDPDGRPLADATVLFTITMPGLEPIVSSELTTAGDGTASFRTQISRGATPGGGLASVLVTTKDVGTVSDRQVLTVIR